MEMIPVTSSNVKANVKAYGYEPVTQKFRVQFGSGSTYEVSNFPQSELSKFIAAPSKGSHYAQYIRGKYPIVKV